MTQIVTLKGVSKSFGALTVTDAVDLAVESGEALGIIGPNGAGKSTLFNLIGGALQPSEGRIYWQNRDITDLSAAQRCRLGIGRSFQIPHPFVGMTVYENLLTAAIFGGDAQSAPQTCRRVLELTGLGPKANLQAGSLGLLERKRLEMARALATSPKVLLLDEIAGGLTEAECHALVATIRDIHASGMAVIWIEHVVHALLAVVERLVVIDRGALVAQGDPKAVMADPMVQQLYLGIDADDAA